MLNNQTLVYRNSLLSLRWYIFVFGAMDWAQFTREAIAARRPRA